MFSIKIESIYYIFINTQQYALFIADFFFFLTWTLNPGCVCRVFKRSCFQVSGWLQWGEVWPAPSMLWESPQFLETNGFWSTERSQLQQLCSWVYMRGHAHAPICLRAFAFPPGWLSSTLELCSTEGSRARGPRHEYVEQIIILVAFQKSSLKSHQLFVIILFQLESAAALWTGSKCLEFRWTGIFVDWTVLFFAH